MRAILTYHSVDPSGSPISVSPEAFRRNVAWLAAGGVRVISVPDLLRSAGDAVAVTFDDGFMSFAEIAWPLLRDHGIPATVFVPTGHAGGTNRWPDEQHSGIPELPLMGWDTLARLAEEGLTIGSHTKTHRDLRSLGDGDLREEMEGSAAKIDEMTGIRPDALAYPYGFGDGRIARAAKGVYAAACTDDFRTVLPDDDRHLLPRLDAYYFQRPGVLERWGTWRFDGYLRARLLGRRVRRGLERAGLLRR